MHRHFICVHVQTKGRKFVLKSPEEQAPPLRHNKLKLKTWKSNVKGTEQTRKSDNSDKKQTKRRRTLRNEQIGLDDPTTAFRRRTPRVKHYGKWSSPSARRDFLKKTMSGKKKSKF